MKKFAAFLAPLIILFSRPAFAKIETLPQSERPKQFIQFEFAQTPNWGINKKQNYGGAQYNFDWQPFGGFAGFQANQREFDLVLRTDYLPFASYHENGVWRFGAATTYHLQRSSGNYAQHDILQEMEVRWISARGLTFTVRNGYAFKLTSFDAIDDLKITNHDFVAYAEIDKLWPCGAEIFTSIGSYNLFRHPLFFCPQWNFGAAYNFKNIVRLGVILELGMTDFWASVAYFNHITVKWNARFMF